MINQEIDSYKKVVLLALLKLTILAGFVFPFINLKRGLYLSWCFSWSEFKSPAYGGNYRKEWNNHWFYVQPVCIEVPGCFKIYIKLKIKNKKIIRIKTAAIENELASLTHQWILYQKLVYSEHYVRRFVLNIRVKP